MDLVTVLYSKSTFKLRFVSDTFAIVVDSITNEYYNVYTDKKGIELLEERLIPHPKFEV